MNIWENTVITNKGKDLHAKLYNGNILKLTRVEAGSGKAEVPDLRYQTEVLQMKDELSVQGVDTSGNITSVLVMLDNLKITERYELWQIGFYAEDPDEGEILYCLAQATEAKVIPAKDESKGYTISWKFDFKSGGEEYPEIQMEPAGFVSSETFAKHRDNQGCHVSVEEKGIYNDKYTKKETEQLFQQFLEQIYPVGSIYTSVTNVNPSAFLGGKWERFGNGRTLFGVDENDGYFNSAQKPGGQKNAVVVSHNHGIQGFNCNEGGYHNHSVTNVHFYDKATAKGDNYARWNSSGNKTTTWGSVTYGGKHQHWIPWHQTDAKGESGEGKNLPPYICVYFWRRTA